MSCKDSLTLISSDCLFLCLDFGSTGMSRIIYTVDKSVLSSFTFFKPNQIIEKAAKGSQKAEHEYKYRYPNAKGGWNYVYDNESEKIKELFSNPLEKLSTIFKLAKEKVHTLYVNHGIKASYNATEKDFAKHILEYKLNKERWDKRFEKLEANQKHKSPVKLNGGKTTQRIQKEVKEVTGQDKKESGEFKPNASLMRKVWAIFNKEKAAESDRKAESEAHENRSQAMLGNDNAKKDFTEADKELALSHIKNDAVKMLEIPYERKEYEKLFPRGEVKTPFETVKLGEHQFERLAAKDGGTRKNLIGAMYQTLKEPCAVIEDVDKQGREAKLYIKSFIGENKNKFTLAVVVDIDGKPVSVSFGERKEKQIEQKIKMAARFYYVAADSPTIGTGQEPLPNNSNISSIGGSVKLSEGDRVSQNGDTGVITNDFKNGLVFVEFDNGSKGRVKVSKLKKIDEPKEPETETVKPKESEIEAHENRSRAMLGNQNARKYGISDKSWNYLQRHFEEFENAGRNIITDTGAIDSDFYRAVMNPDTYLTPEQQKEKFAATDEFDAAFAQNGFKKVSEMLIAMYNDYKGATNAENNTGIEPGRLPDSNEPVQSGQLEENSNKDVHSTENRADRNEPLFSSDESGNGLGRPNSTSDRGRGRITKAQARKIREQCREILKKPDSEITESDKEILSQYVGAGGTDEEDSSNSGVLYEFYTPRNVIKKVWQLVDKYNPNKNKKVIEPSSGIGRFAEDRTENFTLFELEEESARIARILHPDAEVVQGAFQKNFMKQENGRFADKNFDKFDVAVGNPPYGRYEGIYKGRGEGKEFKRYESYFMSRTLDTLKDGGIMAMVVPSSFLNGGSSYGKDLEKIAGKAKLLEAWRLPNGTFDSTDVGTDIVVFQKGDGGKVDDFVNYFANNPDHIAGEVSTRIGRFGEETYIKCKDGETFESAVDNISVDTTDAELLLRETAKITEVKEEKPKKTEAEKHNNRSRAMKGNKNAEGAHEVLNSPDAHIMNVAEFNEKYGKNIDKEDIEIWKATDKYGNIDKSKLTDEQIEYIKNSNHYVFDNGEFVNVVNFASGNIRKKLRELLPNDPQYEYKKKLLEDVMPVERKIGQFLLSPITDWARNYKTKDGLNLIKGFIGWVYNGNGYYSPDDSPVTQEEIPPEISFNDVLAFINREPVRLDRGEKEDDKKLNDRLKFKKKEKRQECANRLFNRYLAEGLGLEDQQDLIKAWNDNFNSFRNPDYTKIPVFVDGMSTHKGMKKFTLTPQQLKGVTQLVNKGTGLLAYDVGVGKTATGIVATVNQIQTGRAKRPLICVPRPTYTNWIRTIKQLFPNIKVNELENMSAKHVSKDFVPEEGSISVCTYEGVENISFNDSEMESLKRDIETVNFYDTGDKKESKRQQASRDEKNETQLGEMTKTRDAGVPFSQMGFDHITVDEVHNFRNLFRMPRRLHNKIATEDNEDIEEEDVSKQSNEFGALGTGGEPSNRAKKLFAITQLIQKKNEGRNTFLLSATPFQNSPLEIYSILSFMARDKLKDLGIYSLEQFVGQFCKLQSEYAVKANKIQEKLVMKDFNNLCALQNLITEYIDKVDGEAAGVVRPYKRTHTPELEMTELQKEIMAQCSEYIAEQEELPKDDRDPGYMFRAMNAMRNCALSPALVDVDFFPDPADKPPMSEIVESSPKLKFVCDSVIGQYKQNSKNGQVIYMPSGVEQFPEVRDYLVKNGIPRDAIALMAGGATSDKAMNARQAVIDEFNDVEGKTKVIIGSSTIKEGVNLQGNSTVIYNTQLDWNPTDAQQVEGRIWRQGNKQGITHIVYPLMYDSIDSMIYQKYDEKSSRLDALFSYQGDTLNVADINPEELKFGLIKDPEKRADLQVMEFTDKNRNDAKMYSQLIDVLHRQVEIAFQSDDVLAKKANDAMHSWSFSVESHTKRYEEENAEAKKYKKLYDELVKKYKGKEDTFENNGAYYTRRNGKEGYEEALTYIGRSYESHKASANNYKETLTHYNKELKKLTDSRESCRKFLANKGINNEADCDAKIKTYVQFMETAKANIEKAKTMRAQFLEEAIKDNKAKEKVLPSLDEMIKDNISSIMNDLHPMDDEFKARRQDENDRLFKRGKYAETPVSKSLDGLKIEFINYVEKEAAKEFYQKSFDGVADRVQFLSNVRHITDKIEQVQSPVELLSLHNASRPLYRSNNRFSKMSGRIRKLVLKGIK